MGIKVGMQEEKRCGLERPGSGATSEGEGVIGGLVGTLRIFLSL